MACVEVQKKGHRLVPLGYKGIRGTKEMEKPWSRGLRSSYVRRDTSTQLLIQNIVIFAIKPAFSQTAKIYRGVPPQSF